jgi:hypothetical protein
MGCAQGKACKVYTNGFDSRVIVLHYNITSVSCPETTPVHPEISFDSHTNGADFQPRNAFAPSYEALRGDPRIISFESFFSTDSLLYFPVIFSHTRKVN